MKRFYSALPSLILVCLTSFLGFAQNPIPNPGFENWTGTEPDHWLTNNTPSINIYPITQSTVSYSGLSSLRAEVMTFGIPVAPYALAGDNGTGFSVSQNYANLTGYYQFIPQASTEILVIQAQLFGSGGGNSVANFTAGTTATSWQQFSTPFITISPGMPDSCFLAIQIVDTLMGFPTVGTYALIDDLELSGVASIKGDNSLPVQGFVLRQNYPNPFNPTTNIEFSIPKSSDVKLVVYNQLGQTVATLVDERLSAGSHSVDWNAEGFPSGVYFYKMTAGDFSKTMKLILMR